MVSSRYTWPSEKCKQTGRPEIAQDLTNGKIATVICKIYNIKCVSSWNTYKVRSCTCQVTIVGGSFSTIMAVNIHASSCLIQYFKTVLSWCIVINTIYTIHVRLQVWPHHEKLAIFLDNLNMYICTYMAYGWESDSQRQTRVHIHTNCMLFVHSAVIHIEWDLIQKNMFKIQKIRFSFTIINFSDTYQLRKLLTFHLKQILSSYLS